MLFQTVLFQVPTHLLVQEDQARTPCLELLAWDRKQLKESILSTPSGFTQLLCLELGLLVCSLLVVVKIWMTDVLPIQMRSGVDTKQSASLLLSFCSAISSLSLPRYRQF